MKEGKYREDKENGMKMSFKIRIVHHTLQWSIMNDEIGVMNCTHTGDKNAFKIRTRLWELKYGQEDSSKSDTTGQAGPTTAWNGFISLRKDTSDGLLWTR
jgi:hypothetical protein